MNLPPFATSRSIDIVHRTRIKFCGITRAEDAVAAAQAGADAIGLVFCASAGRRVAIEQAKEILFALPPFVTPVGLFVNATAAEIREIAGPLRLRHLQLSGTESPEMVAQLSEFIVLKAIHVRANELAETLNGWKSVMKKIPLSNLHGLLLETAGKNAGGTGIENDWIAIEAARAAGAFEGLPAIIAAGGLTVENVGAVVQRLRPWAVDVSSGIEVSRGVKSVEKMNAFAAAVAAADAM